MKLKKSLSYLVNNSSNGLFLFMIFLTVCSVLMEGVFVISMMSLLKTLLGGDNSGGVSELYQILLSNIFGQKYDFHQEILFFAVVSILVSFFKITSLRNQLNFSYKVKRNIANSLFDSYLNSNFVSRSAYSAERLQNILNLQVNIFTDNFIIKFIVMIAGLLNVSIVLMIFLIEDVFLTITSFIILVVFFTLIAKFTNSKLVGYGKSQISATNKVLKYINDISLLNKPISFLEDKSYFLNKFEKQQVQLCDAQKEHSFIANVPRLSIELLIFGIIPLVSFFLMNDKGNYLDNLAIFSTLLLVFFRLLPQINSMYSFWAGFKFASPSIVEFDKIYQLKNIQTTSYSGAKQAIFKKLKLNSLIYNVNNLEKDIHNVVADKGQIIGVIGPTGAGKTLLVDHLAGLMLPIEMSIEFLGKNFRDPFKYSEFITCNISYMDQSSIVFDGDIYQNISFSFDFDKTRINDILNNLKLGHLIGKPLSGLKLSGGEKQRISLARVLYDPKPFCILDEWSSALDEKTESDIEK